MLRGHYVGFRSCQAEGASDVICRSPVQFVVGQMSKISAGIGDQQPFGSIKRQEKRPFVQRLEQFHFALQ